MRGYLLDTNHLSGALRVVSSLRDRLRQTHRQGFRLITCWPVLCELEEGIVFTADPDHYRRTLKAVMKEVLANGLESHRAIRILREACPTARACAFNG
jgi:predicted nucleic acid-binding protein